MLPEAGYLARKLVLRCYDLAMVCCVASLQYITDIMGQLLKWKWHFQVSIDEHATTVVQQSYCPNPSSCFHFCVLLLRYSVQNAFFFFVTGQTEISIFPGLHSPLCSCLSSHSLPKVVKRRVNALKNLQVKCAHIEAKFYEEVHELERKYAALYQPLFDKVRHLHIFSIVTV